MKIKYNAPVVLTFALLCTIVLLISGGIENDKKATGIITWFMIMPNFDFTNFLDYFRLLSHTIGHSNWAHFMGNFGMILVIGPILEEKYGSKLLLIMITITALSSAIATLLLSNNASLGASGIVFMMISLSSLGSFKSGEIPLTFILVAILYIGNEVVNSFNNDNISQLGHIVGGLMGGILGFVYNKTNKESGSSYLDAL
jgi:membrane associated rhomboid family serine protease